jgi:hypothetical protein
MDDAARNEELCFLVQALGLMWLAVSFTILFSESQSILFGLLYLAVYLAIAGISLSMREVMFLVFSVISIYFYIFRLVFDIFENTALFPLILGIIGISIILLAVLFQKYGRRLFRRKN